VTYRLQVAAPPTPKDGPPWPPPTSSWLQAQIERPNVKGVRIESLENGRPEMRATLDRADRFLSLVGLLSAMLAAVAVAMAARRFMQRHLDACAMLRCLGLTQNQVTALYLIEFALVGLAAACWAWRSASAPLCAAGAARHAGPADLPPVSHAAGAAGRGDRHAAAGRLCAAADAPAAQRAAQPRDPPRAGRAAADGAGHLWPGHGGSSCCCCGRPATCNWRCDRGGFLAAFAVFALVGWLACCRCALRGASSITRAGASPSPRCSAALAPPSCRSCRWRWA
jgi:putative ABC transport system permease protein